MTNITVLTTSQLNDIIAIKEQIEKLQSQIESIASGGGEVPSPATVEATVPAKRKLSAAHRRKLVKALAKARKIRWAKIKGEAATDSRPAKKKDGRSSPAVRAKLAAAARARWRKARAEGKSRL
jgi:uncharacterized protein with PIN domain